MRNIVVSNRKEITKFNLNEIYEHFRYNINAINSQFEVAEDLITNQRVFDAENIWRLQIVFLASTFDFYMHELTKYGLCEIYGETSGWEKTKKYKNIQVSMELIESILKSERDSYSEKDSYWFLEHINKYYQNITMVSYESVKDQLNLLSISLKDVADKAFYKRGEKEKTTDKLKRRLNELFNRRNQIAHQTDRNHANAKLKDITKDIVEEFIADIEKIVNAIREVVEAKELSQ
jgi:hypothetical protein